MIRMINQSNVSESQRRNLITDTSNAYTKHLAVIQKVNAGTLDLTRTNIAWKNSVSNVKDSVKALETQENRRVAAAQKSAKELAAIEKKSVADSLALQTKLEQAQTTVFGINTRAKRQLSPDMAAGITRQVETDYQRLAAALKTFGVGSLEAGKATGEFNRAMKAASSEIARVGGLLPRLNDNARTISAAFGAANASVGGFSRAIFNTSAAISALTGAFALREITQSIMEFERFTNTLKTVSGSTGEFNKSLGFLFAEADRIGFAVGEVGNSFARLSLAMKGAGFSANESKDSFSMLAEASRNFGLSSADTMGVIRALEQSMSKGKFMAEEVRLQLGDRLPIAMAALERAVTKVDGKQADLNKRFEEGSLDTKRYGLEFIRQINIMSGGADTLSRTQNSIAAAFGRLNNELVRATTTFGEGGFTNAIVIATQNFISFLQTLREAGVISAAGAAMETLAKHTVLLTAAFTGLAAALSVGIIAKLVGFVAGLTPIGRIIAGLAAAATAAVTLTASLNPAQRALNNLTAAGNDFNRAFDKAKGASEEFRTGITATNSATRAATTEIEKKIDVLRKLGLSEIEVTRIAGEETLKRMALDEKEMERKLKVRQDAIGVRRNAVLSENAGVARLLADSLADERRIAELEKKKGFKTTTAAENSQLQREIDTLKAFGERYADVIKVMRDYVDTTIDTKTALDRLNAVREKDPTLVDAARTAILKNADALVEEGKALKANQERLEEIRREREALANVVKKPQAFLDAFNVPGEVVGPSTMQVEAAKKRANDLAEAIKQFQGKYDDKNFTSQMKDVEKIVNLAGQELKDYGITAKMSSSDILVALAANTAFAQSFSDVIGPVAKFAAEIEKLRNPLRAQTEALKIEIAEQEKLVEAYRFGRAHVMEAEIAQKAHTEALRSGAYMSAEYTAALNELLPLLRQKADQDKSIAAGASIQGMRDEVALLEFQVSLLGKSTEERKKGLAVYLAQKAAEGGDIEEAERLALRILKLSKQLADADRPEVAAARNVREEKYTDTLNAQISAHEGIAAAYRISTEAGEAREIQLKAETEAIRLAKEGEGEKEEIYKNLLVLLPKLAAGEKNVNAAKDLPRMRDEIALLEKERSLLGESLSIREQELAIFRYRQQNPKASPEDENIIRKTVQLRQENDQLENSYKEMANIGVRAFEQVGDAITEAFAKGEIRALNFGNVIRGVMSSIVQSILRLGVVNPIINSIFSGTMLPTLGLGLSVMGGGGAAAAGAAAGGGGGIMQMLGLSSLIPKEGIFGSLGLTGSGGLLSSTIIPGIGTSTSSALGAMGGAYGPASLAQLEAAGGLGLFGGSGASLGSLLGGAGAGFGAGMFVNSLLGGNQTGGMVGSGLGAGAGAILGSIFPGVGTLLGGLIGGAAGGGLGGLFGPKESSRGFGYALRSQDGQLAMTDTYYNEQGRAQFEEANAKIPAINAYLKQRGLTVSGVRAVGGNKYGMGNLGYGEAASFNEALGSLKFAATANEELNKALSTRSFAGPEKLQEFVDGFIALQDTIKGLTADPVPEFKKQMDALIDSFAQATAKAREYGIGEEELLAARDKQIAKLEEQRSLTIRDTALEMHVRRLMAEGMDQEAQRIELAYKTQKEIESFTASLDALGITAGEKSRLLVELERTQAAERVKILKDSNKNIRDYLDSLRTSSPLSGTTTMGRLGAAQELFTRDLASAQTGNVDALNRITQSADTLLNLAREVYASTGGFHDIRGRVVSGLESLSTTPISQQSLPDLASVPLVAEMTNLRTNAAIAETAEYTKRFDSKLAELLPIAEAIQAAVEQANQNVSISSGSVGFGDYTGPDSNSSGSFGGSIESQGAMPAALGAVMKYGRVMAYANGGIPDYVNSPTLAPMALFGEAGPEAIMPLRRGSDGRLGVEVNGSDNHAVVSELRAVRDEIVSLREVTADSDSKESTGLVEAIAELRVQVGGLREELRTARLRAQ
jgi:tape measure domain-containing protein